MILPFAGGRRFESCMERQISFKIRFNYRHVAQSILHTQRRPSSRGLDTPAWTGLDLVIGPAYRVMLYVEHSASGGKIAGYSPAMPTNFAFNCKIVRTFCSGDSSEGSHLFPFRTEKLSPPEAMILRKGKSSSSPEQSA